jgi:LPS export ABC transporter protein LptC
MNLNKNTAVIIAATVLLVGSGLYYFLRAVPEPPPEPVAEQTAGGVEYLGTAFSETKDGKLQWELNADQVQAGEDKKTATLIGLRAKIYKDGGQGNIQLTANEGRMEMTEKIVTLQGNIKATSEKGAELAGNMIKWFMKEHRFTGEGNIQYRQKDTTITGDKLEADLDANIIRVSGNARAELRR